MASRTVATGGPTEPLNRHAAGLPAAVLAQALRLRGGAFTLDAACASSLYALKLAADALRSRRADAVLTGGLSRPDALYTQMGFSQLRALSARMKARPFDAEGDGLVVGEGCGMFLLKRLDDALRDGDRIYALLAGVGVSNDVDGGLLAPSSEGQLRAMRAAYAEAGWQPHEVDLIECHATGTPVGDAVEFASLRGSGPTRRPAHAPSSGRTRGTLATRSPPRVRQGSSSS
ncbi:MAG: polyketide synthase [Isosphaeraceae bacterium]